MMVSVRLPISSLSGLVSTPSTSTLSGPSVSPGCPPNIRSTQSLGEASTLPDHDPRRGRGETLEDAEHNLRCILPSRLRNLQRSPRLPVAVFVQESAQLGQEGAPRQLRLQDRHKLAGLM